MICYLSATPFACLVIVRPEPAIALVILPNAPLVVFGSLIDRNMPSVHHRTNSLSRRTRSIWTIYFLLERKLDLSFELGRSWFGW